ncbi:MAG: M48 family metallopeptidase [Terracidiphilus sp.]
MSMKVSFAYALAGVLWFSTVHPGRGQMPALQEMMKELHVQVRLDPTGEATLGTWSRNGRVGLAPLLPEALHCQSGLKADEYGGDSIRCAQALRRNGLALEAVLDLAPIARKLNGSAPIELWVNYPRLGFESTSVAMTEELNGARVSRTVRFESAVVHAPITIRFGYRPNQLAAVYLPLLALALALTIIAATISRAGFAALALSEIMLGTMVWMCASAQLQADVPLRIMLFGNSLGNFAALFIDLWPPLFCVAIGVAMGSRMRGGQVRSGKFGEVAAAYAIVPLTLTCVVGMLPSMNRGDWAVVVCWVAAAPVFLLARRSWNRIRARASVRQLTTGELLERVSALAAGAGWRQVKLYISFSTRSQTANAFALPGKSIFLTAPLVRSLNKREVDAVAAHELSHTQRASRGGWMALCMAMLFCETPARELIYQLPGGLPVAMVVPIAVYFAALYGTRKREFAADANSAALTGDPRAMISSLARVVRNNDHPLDMPPILEWFSSHPSTRKRIQALAARARLGAAEVEALCSNDQPGEHYELPTARSGGEHLFTLAWQQTNSGVYSWTVVLGSGGSGLLVAWLLERFAGFGVVSILGGIVLGCALTKGAAAYVMSSNYARLRRKLESKLRVEGQLVGLAPEGEPRIYNAFRFSDAGLLRFENGRLCYQSERASIMLNPADVLQVGMVAAAPSNWFRRQPMVEFRDPQSGQPCAFILHTLYWFATQRRLLRSIERWRATERSQETTSINGFDSVAGQTFVNPTIAGVARGFLVTGGIALAAAVITSLMFPDVWQYIPSVVAVTACAYISMLLPAMLYRPPAAPCQPVPAAGAN